MVAVAEGQATKRGKWHAIVIRPNGPGRGDAANRYLFRSRCGRLVAPTYRRWDARRVRSCRSCKALRP